MRKHLTGYVVFGLVVTLFVMLCAVNAKAEFKVEFPMESNITGFWFPANDSIAVGLSHTVVRLTHLDLPKFSLDFDGTLAKEVNLERDNFAGIGIKLSYNVKKADKSGFLFAPSLGITAVNNVKSFKTVFQDYKIAIYGTLILYRWSN